MTVPWSNAEYGTEGMTDEPQPHEVANRQCNPERLREEEMKDKDNLRVLLVFGGIVAVVLLWMVVMFRWFG